MTPQQRHLGAGGRENRWVLPQAFAERARKFVAEGLAEVPPRRASTVMLLRDGDSGLEVYAQVRQSSMPFAGGMLAFPGGGADPVDAAAPVLGEDGWAVRLVVDAESARTFVHAAIRETREETGVALATEDLHPWAHWVTPRFEPRRYDTWFFVASLPDGATPQDVSGEASSAAWVAPTEALESAAQGAVTMLPPTRLVLDELARFESVASCLKAARNRQIEVVMPGWIDDGDTVRAVLPGDDEYPGDDPGGQR